MSKLANFISSFYWEKPISNRTLGYLKKNLFLKLPDGSFRVWSHIFYYFFWRNSFLLNASAMGLYKTTRYTFILNLKSSVLPQRFKTQNKVDKIFIRYNSFLTSLFLGNSFLVVNLVENFPQILFSWLHSWTGFLE